MNPSDQAIKLVNTDFPSTVLPGDFSLDSIHNAWLRLEEQYRASSSATSATGMYMKIGHVPQGRNATFKTLILIQRNLLNYRRNILAFGIRSEFSKPASSYFHSQSSPP